MNSKTLAVASLLWSTLALGAAQDAFLIVPGQGIGPLRVGMSQQEVEKRLPAQSLGTGEEDGKPSLSAYFMNPKQRIALRFDAQGKLSALTLHGAQSVWHDARGITLGTPLSTLAKLNGKPFSIHAFDGSAQSGRVLDWHGGALEKQLPKVQLTFASPMHAAGYGKLNGPQKEELEKARDFLSSAVELQKLNPTLETIELSF